MRGGAIGATAFLKDRFDLLAEFLVGLGARPLRFVLVRIIAAGADFQHLGQCLHLILRF